MELIINSYAIDCVNSGDNVPKVLRDYMGRRAFRLNWHSTDGWRGYYKITPVKKYGWKPLRYADDLDLIAEDWQEFTDGWVTGDYEDAPYSARGSVVESKLKEIAEVLGKKNITVMVVFTPSSNVFSTNYDVFYKEERED